jgi:hypothetical protein
MIKSGRLRWVGYVASMGAMRNAYDVLCEKIERKRPPGRCRHGWEDNIKVDLEGIGWRVWNSFIWFRIGTVCVVANLWVL